MATLPRQQEQVGGEGDHQSTPLWEKSKENAAPIERGRNVSVLERSILAMESSCNNPEGEHQRAANDRQLQYFEQLVYPLEVLAEQQQQQEEAEVGTDGRQPPNLRYHADFNYNDPLIHWLSYIKHQQDTNPADTHQNFLLLERCFRSMHMYNNKQYANDVRFVRLCCSYIDKTARDYNRANEIFM